MNEEKYFKDVLHECDKSPVFTWLFVDIKEHDIRVYFKPDSEIGCGFIFYAVENVGYICCIETDTDKWHPEFCHIECVYQGIAYWDGIRHLYMGDESTNNYGYHYYPEIEANIKTLLVLSELEKKYCRE